MTVRKTRDIRRALTAKGFRPVETHHELFLLYVEGRKTSVRTRISHGAEEYGSSLLSQVAKQVRLNRTELDDFLECPMTADRYRKLLLQRGHVKLPEADG